MIVSTTRFGDVEITEERVITFEQGLLGFPAARRFTLLHPIPDGPAPAEGGAGVPLYWLQSLERPELAFVVTDPGLFVADYRIALRKDDLEALGLVGPETGQVLVIVNRYPDCLTANLQGPLVINLETRAGVQCVLADGRWSTRHRLAECPAPAHAASA